MKNTTEELVLLAKKGDQEAISALYEQTYNSVYQSVRAIMKDEEEALDVVQDSYIKGFQNLEKLEDPGKFQAWMKQIAANQARDYLRKKRPVLFSERVNQEGEELDLQHPDECMEHLPDEVIDRQETTRLMNDILSTLSEGQRLAICMFYYEEQSIKEIAQTLNCSENTVKSRLNYGRKKIEAAVKALEKQGTKLYSLAPLPFFLWLLRMAKGYGISAQAVAGTSAAGIAGAAAAAGETAAAASGSSAAGSAAAGTAAKTAGSAAGKALATKIVAGTLAVTMTVGAGVAITNKADRQKENEEAHRVYSDIMDTFVSASDLGFEQMRLEDLLFIEEISEDVLAKYPDDLDNARSVGPVGPEVSPEDRYVRTLHFPKWGSPEFEDGIGVPDYLLALNYGIAPFGQFVTSRSDGLEYNHGMNYGFSDLDDNGIDELLIRIYDRAEPQKDYLYLFNYYDGEIHIGYILERDNQWRIHIFSNYEFPCRIEGRWVEEDCYHIRIEFANESLFDPDDGKNVDREYWQIPEIEYQHLWG